MYYISFKVHVFFNPYGFPTIIHGKRVLHVLQTNSNQTLSLPTLATQIFFVATMFIMSSSLKDFEECQRRGSQALLGTLLEGYFQTLFRFRETKW